MHATLLSAFALLLVLACPAFAEVDETPYVPTSTVEQYHKFGMYACVGQFSAFIECL